MHTAVIAASLNRVDEWFLAKAFLIGCLGTFGMNFEVEINSTRKQKMSDSDSDSDIGRDSYERINKNN